MPGDSPTSVCAPRGRLPLCASEQRTASCAFEVTEEMVRAGARALMRCDLAWEPYEAIARDVLLAAARVAE